MTKSEAEKLARQQQPLFGWIDQGNGVFTTPQEPEIYGATLEHVSDGRGSQERVTGRTTQTEAGH